MQHINLRTKNGPKQTQVDWARFHLIHAYRVLKLHCGSPLAPTGAEKRSIARNDVAWCSFHPSLCSHQRPLSIATKIQCKQTADHNQTLRKPMRFKYKRPEQTAMNAMVERIGFISGQNEQIHILSISHRPSIQQFPRHPIHFNSLLTSANLGLCYIPRS